MKRSRSIFTRTFFTLLASFGLYALITIAIILYAGVRPLEKASADDLASMMLTSLQTWVMLPESARSEYEKRLWESNRLKISAEAPAVSEDEQYSLRYLSLVEEALRSRTGHEFRFKVEKRSGRYWYWLDMVQNNQAARVGFCSDRLGVVPTEHIMAAVAAALLLMLLTAAALAMRARRPLQALCQAFDKVGKGQVPDLKPSHIKELDQFIEHFNQMSQQVCSMLDNRTTLLGGISHDLRTPLTRMRLSLELLQRHCDEKLVARMIHDVEQMNDMIDESMRLAKALEPGRMESVDLVKLIQQVIDLHEEERQRIQFEHSQSCVCQVHDAALKRILLNLLQNALRYSDDKLVEVRLVCGQEQTLIEVLDRGPGIPADQLEAIFRPFHRLEQSRNEASGGSGLGLAIADQLARANDCHLEIEERAGGGSVFRVVLTASTS